MFISVVLTLNRCFYHRLYTQRHQYTQSPCCLFILETYILPPLLPHTLHARLDPAPRLWQAPIYMINTLDRSITHNVAKISVDQILDLIVNFGVYFNSVCDLNLFKTAPHPPPPPRAFFNFIFSSLSLARTPHLTINIEIRQSIRHFHTVDIASLPF